jgi:hypothetical protein
MPVVSFVPVVVVLVIALLPAASVIALGLWARWLRRRALVPRWAVSIAYGLVVLGALPFVVGAVWGWAVMGTKAAERGDKARMLGEGISEAMNCGSLGVMIAVIGLLWLGFCTWRWRKKWR